jgi:molybdopterin/thiamine biosynthesis adenylyltransferase
MDDQQLLRYSRHILLPEIGIEGQERLLASHVLIIGAGGLGSPVAMYLAASGIGTLSLCDDDDVDLTNLQRQLLHRTSSIGQSKVASAQQTLNDVNPGTNIIAHRQRVDESSLSSLVNHADVVVDCSDNFSTRYALNRICFSLRKPLVSGAATRFDGQLSVFDFRDGNSPCYHCLYPEQTEAEETRCAVMGVYAPLVGVIGSLQAAEAMKLLLESGSTLSGRLLIVNLHQMQLRTITYQKDDQCPVCS